MNPFQKLAQQKQVQADTNGANSGGGNKLNNPFAAKTSSAANPPNGNGKPRNPFAKPAAESGTVPSPPSGATPPATAANSSLPRTEEKAAVANGEGKVAQAAVTAEEFVHESQPAAYTQDQVDNLQLALASLEQAFGGRKEQIADSIRLVGSQIGEHPALCGIMRPTDWGLFVRGLRESYGTVIAKKGVRREKKSARAADEAEVDDILNSLDGFNF